MATAAAQLLVIGSIAAAFAFQPKETQLPIAMIPVQADIEQGECIRRDPAPYEPITYLSLIHICDLIHFPVSEKRNDFGVKNISLGVHCGVADMVLSLIHI